MKAAKKIIIIIIILFLLYEVYQTFGDVIIAFANESIDDLQNKVGWLIGILSFIGYIKYRVFDSKMLNRLKKDYSKQKLIEVMEIQLHMLEFLSPEEIIKKVKLISRVEIEMRKALVELNNMLLNAKPSSTITDYMNKKENKEFSKKIKQLLELMNKELEVHYLSKKIIESPIKETFETNLTKSKAKSIFIDKYDEQLKEKGKKAIIDNMT